MFAPASVYMCICGRVLPHWPGIQGERRLFGAHAVQGIFQTPLPHNRVGKQKRSKSGAGTKTGTSFWGTQTKPACETPGKDAGGCAGDSRRIADPLGGVERQGWPPRWSPTVGGRLAGRWRSSVGWTLDWGRGAHPWRNHAALKGKRKPTQEEREKTLSRH